MLRKYKIGLLGVSVALLLLGACGDTELTRVLLLDMDAYQANTNLSISLPGLPEGDRAENISIAELATNEEIPGNSLRVEGQIDLIPVNHDEPTEYEVQWDGYRSTIGNTGTTTIEFLDQSERVGFGVSFDGATGDLQVLTSSTTPDWDFSGNQGHSVTIVVNPNLNSFSFNFEQEDCPGFCPEASSLSFLDPDFGPIRRVRIEGAEYFLDDLSILLVE